MAVRRPPTACCAAVGRLTNSNKILQLNVNGAGYWIGKLGQFFTDDTHNLETLGKQRLTKKLINVLMELSQKLWRIGIGKATCLMVVLRANALA